MIAIPPPPVPRLFRAMARARLLVLLLAVFGGVLGGVVSAVLDPAPAGPVPGEENCTQPPCFDIDMPSGASLLTAAPAMGHVLAAAWFAGPLIVLLGYELVPHVVNPCLVADLAGVAAPRACEGSDVTDRWHGLHHALIGGVPLTLLYLRALRRSTSSPGGD